MAEELLRIEGATLLRRARPGELGFRLTVERFSAAAGARIGLIGPSGSGKSTMLELICLLLRPERIERFTLVGADAAPALRRRDLDAAARLRRGRLAYAPQNAGLLPFLSVAQNATLAARLAGVPGDGLDRTIAERAAAIGLGDLLAKPPAQLSGGERHRAALLRMAAARARVFVADEPTAALDHATAEGVMRVMADAAEQADAALICASHDVAMLRRFGFALFEIAGREAEDRAERRATLAEAA
jgi:putative ABC transport system ATP-binding protein